MGSLELFALSSPPRQALLGLQGPNPVCPGNSSAEEFLGWAPEAPGASTWVPLLAEVCFRNPLHASMPQLGAHVYKQGNPGRTPLAGTPRDLILHTTGITLQGEAWNVYVVRCDLQVWNREPSQSFLPLCLHMCALFFAD